MRPVNENNDESLNELVDSIRSQGILNPLLVRSAPNSPEQYEVYAGHRRLLAAKKLGLETVPCQVSQITDIEAQVRSLVENYQRVEPSNAEKVRTFCQLYKNLGQFDFTGVGSTSIGFASGSFDNNQIKMLCGQVGVKPRTLKRYLQLGAHSSKVLEYLDRDKNGEGRSYLTLTTAEQLLGVPQESRELLVEQMVKSQLSNAEMKQVIRSFIAYPNENKITEYINGAISEASKSRQQETPNEQQAPEASSNEANALEPSSPEPCSPEPSSPEHVQEPVPNDSDPVDPIEDQGPTIKASKKDPWLHDPQDKKREVHAIPSEHLPAFWQLHCQLTSKHS